ncbi:MAG: hypothetical protein HW408_1710, partial [Actinobacteria bacterium]|nr:hypothetical protein [Actinomycetota bacterium]
MKSRQESLRGQPGGELLPVCAVPGFEKQDHG